MSVELESVLGFVLGEVLGGEVEVVDYSFDVGEGRLCVEVVVEGVVKRGCVIVEGCRGRSDWEECVARVLSSDRGLVERLAGSLGEGLAAGRGA
ncbi:hypothetical protein Pyrfu_0415 [Pyrolobus fumarii 1A]|uniref:Uncharacterized protein n=1 Tax=Pyrolobus fumarii (strain DSM 11204 / 1A) TaxID=694429 RepID=G0EG38_PYRF1|nr:hypothetical protein [Pyrolobus fumarii]AEM38286.1 hypothetical protein Pyrfu_0415 [Pyrolobus fumarii 1A]